MADDQSDAGGGSDAPAPPDQSASPQQGSPGGGTLAPQGAAGSRQVDALGKEAMARGIMTKFLHIIHTQVFPVFQLGSPEGKAIHKMLSAGSIFASGGKEAEDNKNSAMGALMQRAMQARQGGGQPGQQPGMQQPNRGPIPSTTGGGQ